MILKEALSRAVKSQFEDFQKREVGIPRELLERIDLKSNHVIIISGIRRTGKSTLLHQLMGRVDKAGYFNFEDPRVIEFTVEDFERLKEVIDEKKKTKTYFFDEIQNVKNWEIFVRSEQDRKLKLFITGSNASLLSIELGTRLTGRHINYELFPFSYSEFIRFKKTKKNIHSFDLYFKLGGFPEYLQFENPQVLHQLFEDIIMRDIVARYGLKNPTQIKELALYLTTNIGKEFSNNKLKQLFNLGSANTVASYISFFSDSYLFFTIPRFSYSVKQQIRNNRKVYSVDHGLIRKLSKSFSPDEGRLLENIVFVELRKRYKEVFYFRGDHECDFLVKDAGKIINAIQVTMELSDINYQRETDGLIEALNYTKLKEGLILTYDYQDEISVSGKNIKIVPVWKWLST